MPRKTTPAELKAHPPPAGPHVIHPTAVYDRAQARHALGLAKATLKREIRMGRLQVARRAGKYLILGEWLLRWIAHGEVQRRKPADATDRNGAAAHGDDP